MSSDEARVWLLPEHLPFADAVTETLWPHYAAQAPDFSSLTLVTPGPGLALALQGALLQRAGGALLVPVTHTLATLSPAAHALRSPLACRIRIAEAVTRHRRLFPAQAPLSVADSLYALFEELAQQQLAPCNSQTQANNTNLPTRRAWGVALNTRNHLPVLSTTATAIDCYVSRFLF